MPESVCLFFSNPFLCLVPTCSIMAVSNNISARCVLFLHALTYFRNLVCRPPIPIVRFFVLAQLGYLKSALRVREKKAQASQLANQGAKKGSKVSYVPIVIPFSGSNPVSSRW